MSITTLPISRLSTTECELCHSEAAQPANIDSDTRLWIEGYFPYMMIFITGYWTQLTLYWIIGTYSNDMKDSSRAGGVFRAYETAGQAVSYGLSSSTSINAAGPAIPLYINLGLLVCVIPSMYLLINRMPTTPIASCEDEASDVANETSKA